MEGIILIFTIVLVALSIYILKLRRELKVIEDLINGETLEENFDERLVSSLVTKLNKKITMLNLREEKALSQTKSTQALISDISHQTKTPLSNILMYIDLMEQNNTLKYLNILKSQVEKLIFLNEQLIKGSRLEQGMIKLNKKELYIDEILRKVAKVEGIKINLESSKLKVFADEKWIEEAIGNIFNNAKKYGSERVDVLLKRGSNYCKILIEDENEFIDENEYSKIFQRFYRGKNSNQKEGYGLGLYITREILISSGGGIKIEKGNSGNIFVVTIPMY